MTELPLYQSHKRVRAGKIAALEANDDGSAKIAFEEAGLSVVEAPAGWMSRFRFDASDGDLGYFVQYSDGYTSWSPSKPFEEGYTRLGKGS
jgi:hypothetical protein